MTHQQEVDDFDRAGLGGTKPRKLLLAVDGSLGRDPDQIIQARGLGNGLHHPDARDALRLWAAFSQLPVAAAPAGGSAGRRAGSKQARVIGLMQRPEGATIDEIASAMGWQRHTVRGLISGALVSEKTDRGRFSRISESRSAAR
jgi:hypothetical protein